MHATVRLRNTLAGLLTGLLLLSLGACGGGSGSADSTSAAVAVKSDATIVADASVTAPTSSAPTDIVREASPVITTHVRFEGPITGFGSVIVNNVRFNDNGATIHDEDMGALARADLRLGSYVVIDGQTDTTGASVAQRIAVIPAVRGRIESIDSSDGSLTVLRQSVRVDSATVFEGSSFNQPLAVGDFVEVHGVAGNGSIRASLVERKSGPYLASARGVISNLNREARHFCIGPLLVLYGNASFLPSADALENGVFVSVRASREPQAERLEADIVRVRTTPAEQQGDAEHFDIKGIVESEPDADGRFWVSGLKVEPTEAALLPKGGFVVGQPVLMRGAYRDRFFVVERISTEMSGPTPASSINQLIGTLANRVGKSFTVNGVEVDANAALVEGGSLDGLDSGAFVEVRGSTVNAPAGTIVHATEVLIRQRPPLFDTAREGQRQSLYGAIYQFVSAGQFMLNGQAVDASAAQFRRGDVSGLGNDIYVELHGTRQGGVLVATVVEFRRLRASRYR